MRNIIRALCTVVMVVMCPSVQPAGKSLTLGSVAMDIPAEMHKRLKPLTEYLTKELGVPVNLRLSPNMGSAIKEIAEGKVDFAYLTPVAYTKSHAQGNTRLIAKTATDGMGTFRLMISVRNDSPLKSVDDLKGKVFAFGDKAALLQRAVVVGAGIRLEDFSEYKFLGHYDNIARGISSGDFDAGILKDTKAYAWQKKGLRILYQSEPLPPYNITARKGLDEKTYTALKNAFLKLDSTNKQHADVIKALNKKYSGFLPTTDEEYNIVRKLILPFKD